MNEEHDGKRKAELNWKIHRIHWEKNRFIFDLMYTRKVRCANTQCPLINLAALKPEAEEVASQRHP